MIYVSHLLEDDEMKELLQSTSLGIESIEFSIAENLDHLEQTLITYEKRLERMGCEELILHGPFLDLNPAAYDSLVAKATKERYEQAYTAAKKLGAKKIIYHSCFMPGVYLCEGWADRVAAFYQEFLEDKSKEIQILMENVLDPVPALLWESAERILHPAFGLCLDVGHVNCYSREPLGKWISENGPYVKHFHVHDNRGDRDAHLAVGQGTVDWEDAATWLKSGVDCTIECSTLEAVVKSYETLQLGISARTAVV